MNTEDNNKMIAEFMGLNIDNGVQSDYMEHELKYHKDWNWLMPVVKKINQVCGYDDYNKSRLHLQRVLNDCINENAVGIDEVHKAIVEFINQYNKTK